MKHHARFALTIVTAFAAAAIWLASPRAIAAAPSTPIRSLTSLVAWCGSYSAVKDERFIRATAPEQWAALWTEHCGAKIERDSYGEPVTPQVDFQQCIVVGILGGQRTNTRSLQIVAVDEFSDHVRVRYENRSYQTASLSREVRAQPGETAEDAMKRSMKEFLNDPDREGGANHTTPYGLFVLPRSDKPIVIEQALQTKKGVQGWKERIRFDVLK